MPHVTNLAAKALNPALVAMVAKAGRKASNLNPNPKPSPNPNPNPNPNTLALTLTLALALTP